MCWWRRRRPSCGRSGRRILTVETDYKPTVEVCTMLNNDRSILTAPWSGRSGQDDDCGTPRIVRNDRSRDKEGRLVVKCAEAPGARSRDRTGTPSLARDFKSRVSTSFTIRAARRILAQPDPIRVEIAILTAMARVSFRPGGQVGVPRVIPVTTRRNRMSRARDTPSRDVKASTAARGRPEWRNASHRQDAARRSSRTNNP